MAIDFSETQDLDSVYRAIGRRVLRLVKSRESLEFAAKPSSGAKKTKQCQKGYSCGYSCVAKTKNCKSPLSGQGKNYADWLTNQIASGAALLPHHQADAQTMGIGGQPQPAATPKKTRAKKSSTTPTATPTPTQTAPSPVKTNQTELDSKRADLVQRFGQKTVDAAEQNVKRILDDADVFVRVGSSSTLEAILGDRFKTSAELNVTNHQIPHLKDKNYQDARNRVEAKTLGYDKNTDPADRPIYGYLGGKDLNGQSHADVSQAYGSIALKLKSDVKDRTTFTGSDSFKSGVASKLDDPNAASLVSSTRHGYDKDNLPNHYPGHYGDKSADGGQLRAATKAKSIDDLTPALSPTGNAYMEAQIHGKVTPKDIAEIHFSPRGVGDRPNAAIAQFAKDNGVDLYVNGKKLGQKELDDIITPPKRTRINELNDAIEKGDFNEVLKIADEVNRKAGNLTLKTGERDSHLKALYELSGYDGLPKVGTAADVTQAWKDGGTLMVRGVAAGVSDRNQYLKQFQTGDYFTGNGVYGNGTYVGHAGNIVNGKFVGHDPKNEAKDAKRAFNGVAKHNYINPSSVTFRMALASDATVGIQSQVEKERDATRKKLEQWRTAEEQKIRTSGITPTSAADTKRYNAALKQAETDNNALRTATPKQTAKKTINAVDEELTYSVSGANNTKVKFAIRAEQDFFSALRSSSPMNYYYRSANGDWKQAKNQADALSRGQSAAIDRKNQADALKSTGLTHAPGDPNNLSPAIQRQIRKLNDNVERTKEILGLDPHDQGALGRFGVVRGYDAIALDQSYEPNTFMNLLNRSKVVIQQDPLSYNQAKKTGAL